MLSKAPTVPALSGPAAGVVGVLLEFTATATDPDGDSIAFQFSWGDGDTSDWTVFVASGETATASHAYADSATYGVQARAKDNPGVESDWSAALEVEVADLGAGYPDSLYGEVSVSGGVRSGVVTPDGRHLYLTHDDENFITPLRLGDRQVLPAVVVGPFPFDIDVTPDGQFVYVTCTHGTSVTSVRVADNTVAGEVEVGGRPSGITITPDGSRAYVALTELWRMAVVSIPANEVVDTISVEGGPYHLVASPAGDYVYASLFYNGSVGAVRTSDNTLVATSPVGDLPSRLALSPDGQYLYVANHSDSGLAVFRTPDLERIDTVRVGSRYIDDVAVLPDGDFLLATDWYGIRYASTQLNAVVDSLPYGGSGGLAVHPSGDSVYVFSNRRVYVVGR